MNTILYLLILGFCLSIDAFSVSLNLGWQIKNKTKYFYFALLVGIMHFIMPILGAFLGTRIKPLIFIKTDLLMGIILLFIALTSIVNLYKEENILDLSNLSLIYLALGVSLDSFTVGIGLLFKNTNIILASFLFSICSFSFTYLGLFLGKYMSTKFEKNFKKLGITLLLLLGTIHILK